jgi:hypothetical protein
MTLIRYFIYSIYALLILMLWGFFLAYGVFRVPVRLACVSPLYVFFFLIA